MFPLVAGSLAIALVEGQVFVIQGNWWTSTPNRGKLTAWILVLSTGSYPQTGVEIMAFYPSGGFSFLADLKEYPPIRNSDILHLLPSSISYSEGTLLELPQ